jgi:signal transduction histidine kinase/CheY-like chemotaxis protein
MLRRLFAKIAPHFGLDTFFNFMVNEAGDALRLEACAGIPEEEARKITRLEFGQAVCGTVALHRQLLVATNIQQSDDPKVQLVKGYGIRAYACNPLLAGGRLLGTLSFASRTRDQFEPGEVEFLETISHYVTVAYERLRLIGQLREADRKKDEFLATLAHELRNPLAPIRNALQILRLADGNKEAVVKVRSIMERQLQQMVRLVDDLLDASRISRNKLILRKERVGLDAVLQNAVEVSRPLIEASGHELTVAVPQEPLFLDADPTRLAQVFVNLLNNAAKYTNRGGHIRLTVEREGSDVVVAVADTGIGIPADMLPRVFEMFTQVDRSLERSQGGLGIGLSLVKKLVEMHGGSVEARSDGPGKGSRFAVRLPVVLSLAHETQRVEGGGDQAGRPGRRRILVVDDNRDSAESLALMLRMMGNEVFTAHDGLEAVEAAGNFRPDVVLLDLGMPKMNGYAAARCIRQQAWGRNMVLVALTGWGQEEDRRKSKEAGFDHHLVKPVEASTLERLLAELQQQAV